METLSFNARVRKAISILIIIIGVINFLFTILAILNFILHFNFQNVVLARIFSKYGIGYSVCEIIAGIVGYQNVASRVERKINILVLAFLTAFTVNQLYNFNELSSVFNTSYLYALFCILQFILLISFFFMSTKVHKDNDSCI